MGTIVITASGGTSPYQYRVDGDEGDYDDENTLSASVSPATHTYYVKDNNGCVVSAGFSIAAAPRFSVTFASDEITICQGETTTLDATVVHDRWIKNYTLTALPSGASAGMPGSTSGSENSNGTHHLTFDVSPTTTTVYTLSVQDNAGSPYCSIVRNVTVTVKPTSAYTENLTACDSLWWHDTKYTTAQTDGSVTYTSTGGAANGCDSTTTLNLTEVYTTAHTAYTASGLGSYTWATDGDKGHGDGIEYNASGDYVGPQYNDANGCHAHDTLHLTITPINIAGVLNGKFSVAADKKVLFSQGNLQYINAPNDGYAAQSFRFALHQYDFVGGTSTTEPTGTFGNVYLENGTQCGNQNVSNSYTGWIDLFGWGTSKWNSGASNYMPYSTETTGSTYNPGGSTANNLTGDYANADWGVYNPIVNGGNSAGQFRVLTSDEWSYLYNDRTNAASKRSQGRINLGGDNYVKGVILLPDEWMLPTGCTFVTDFATNGYTTNTYTLEQWALMQANGAVFLPQAGRRDGTAFKMDNYYRSRYWSSTKNGENMANAFDFYNTTINPSQGVGRGMGNSVRLVFDDVDCVTSSGAVSETVCDSYLWAANGVTYNASGTYTARIINRHGCDSTVTLTLTIKLSKHYTDNHTACDSLWWHGVKYTTTQTDGSVTYTSTGGAANGCDSITTLNLTAVYTTGHTAYHNTVDVNYTWGTDPATNGGYGHGNGNTYDSDGKYVGSSYTDAHGCTAHDTLYLTVTGATCEPTAGIDEQNICGSSYDWIDGNTYTENTTSATYTLTNSCGEDSVVTLHLTLNLAAAITSVTGGDLDQEATTTTAITPITFAFANATLSATGLPDGVTLNTTTGVLSGTATEAGDFDYTITATSTYGCSDDSRSGTLTIVDCNGSDPHFRGLGTQQCPFLITDYDTLRTMEELVNAGDATYNASTVYYKQTADIDVAEATGVSTKNWGTSTYPTIGKTAALRYKANYDGDGHSITGLNVNSSGAHEGSLALFGYVGGGSIKNLSVSGDFTNGSKRNMGVIIGNIEDDEEITNCTSNGSITFSGKTSSGDSHALYGDGGIIGMVNSGTVTITGCTNNATFTQPTGITDYFFNIGGMIGRSDDVVTITNCINNGTVSMIPTSKAYGKVGGMIGYTTAALTISNCRNTADFTSYQANTQQSSFGGIVGLAENGASLSISSCQNSGNIVNSGTTTSTFQRRHGGIIGSIKNVTTASVTNNINSGAITNYIGNNGGIVGFINGTSSSVTISGNKNISTTNGVSSYTTSGGSSLCGAGIVGYIESALLLTLSENRNNAPISGYNYLGGICGYSRATTIIFDRDTNIGSVTGVAADNAGICGIITSDATDFSINLCINEGAITGTTEIGGIIGKINNSSGSIFGCTNTGTINATTQAGGIAGNIPNNGFSIDSCTNKSTATITFNGATGVGGIVGAFPYVNIKRSINEANISGGSSSKWVGGIVGSCGRGYIDSCLNTGNITISGRSSSNDGCLGGIVGYLANTNSTPTYITNCGNVGNLSNSCKETGGIIGYANGQYMHIVNCYNHGNFTISGTCAGGLVGFLYTTVSKIYIKNCYSTGLFSSISNTFAPLTYPGSYASKVSTTFSYAINTAATNATYTSSYCNPTTTFDGSTGVLTAPQTIDGSSRTILQSAVSAWQSANTPYETVSIPLSTWTTATLPRLTWE